MSCSWNASFGYGRGEVKKSGSIFIFSYAYKEYFRSFLSEIIRIQRLLRNLKVSFS